jgi:hypothetical protein
MRGGVGCLAVVVSTLLGAPAPAAGAEREAKALYDQAEADYRAGRYREAIERFDRAYQLVGDPVLLFNIAQAHRRRRDWTRAIDYYERFLERAADRPTPGVDLEEVNRRVAELRDLARAERPDPPPAVHAALPPPPVRPQVAFGIDGGVSRLRVDAGGGPRWQQPVLPVLRLGLRLRPRRWQGRLEAGASASFSPFEYWDQRQVIRRHARLTEVAAVAGARPPITGRLSGLVEVGLGLQLWSGLHAGNPLTGVLEGVVALPCTQLGLGLSFDLGQKVSLRLRSAFSWAPAMGTRFAAKTRDVRQTEIVLGAGYAFER